MTAKVLGGVVALGLIGAVAAAAPPAGPGEPDPARKVVRWPGGWMYLDGPEMIVRQTGPNGSKTTISGTGNGVGNKTVVTSGDGPGITVIRNSRNGVDNTITVTPAGPVFDDKPAAARTAPVLTKKDGKFWSKKAYSDALDCPVYWSPKTANWYRYDKRSASYKPLPPGIDLELDTK